MKYHSNSSFTCSYIIYFFIPNKKFSISNFFKTSKAALGDKTMMDALRPATEALVAALNNNEALPAAFTAASAAASEGSEKAKDYVAKFGRARTMGERAIGQYDPGAVSISHIFRGFAQAIN